MKNPSKLDVFHLQSNSGGFFSVRSSFSLGYLIVTRVPKAAGVGSPFWTGALRQNPF
jgi:hypothetical protein